MTMWTNPTDILFWAKEARYKSMISFISVQEWINQIYENRSQITGYLRFMGRGYLLESNMKESLRGMEVF